MAGTRTGRAWLVVRLALAFALTLATIGAIGLGSAGTAPVEAELIECEPTTTTGDIGDFEAQVVIPCASTTTTEASTSTTEASTTTTVSCDEVGAEGFSAASVCEPSTTTTTICDKEPEGDFEAAVIEDPCSSTTTSAPRAPSTTSSTTSSTTTSSTSTTSTTAAPGASTTTTVAPAASSTTVAPTSTTVAPTSTTVPNLLRAASPTQQFVGVFSGGQSGNIVSCGFAPGSTVGLALNGVGIGTDDVDGQGCATQQLDVTGTIGVALGRSESGLLGVLGLRGYAQTVRAATASIAIDGRPFRARIGDNALVVSGTNPAGQPFSVTNTFRITAPAPAEGGLARTGVEVVKWSVIALLLIALGVALLVPQAGQPERD